MEKKSPHYRLSLVKKHIEAGNYRFTNVARTGAALLGIGIDQRPGVISSLEARDFYKSMTSHEDHKVWHDVYRPSTEWGEIYIKITILEKLVIISFKEL